MVAAVAARHEPTAAHGAPLPPHAACDAVCEALGTDTPTAAVAAALRLAGEANAVRGHTVALALALGLPPAANLQQCAAAAEARRASAADGGAIIDAESARLLLTRLRAHDGPSALGGLDQFEAQAAEYRKALARAQEQMQRLAQGAAASAAIPAANANANAPPEVADAVPAVGTGAGAAPPVPARDARRGAGGARSPTPSPPRARPRGERAYRV